MAGWDLDSFVRVDDVNGRAAEVRGWLGLIRIKGRDLQIPHVKHTLVGAAWLRRFPF